MRHETLTRHTRRLGGVVRSLDAADFEAALGGWGLRWHRGGRGEAILLKMLAPGKSGWSSVPQDAAVHFLVNGAWRGAGPVTLSPDPGWDYRLTVEVDGWLCRDAGAVALAGQVMRGNMTVGAFLDWLRDYRGLEYQGAPVPFSSFQAPAL